MEGGENIGFYGKEYLVMGAIICGYLSVIITLAISFNKTKNSFVIKIYIPPFNAYYVNNNNISVLLIDL